MSVNSVSGQASIQAGQQPTIQRTSDKIQQVIANLISNNAPAQSDNVANVSVAAQLQSSLSGLRQLAENLAQAGSLTQVAGGGISNVQDSLVQLQQLAQKASSANLSDSDRQSLDVQFQQIASSIDQAVNDTTFNGQPLFSGNVADNNAISLDQLFSSDEDDTGSLSLPALSTQDLFGGQLSLSSATSAAQASQQLSAALTTVGGVGSNVAAFQQSVDFAAATVDSAAFNQEAATSTLDETDFSGAAPQLSLASLQQNAGAALAAQGNLLNPALLTLVS